MAEKPPKLEFAEDSPIDGHIDICDIRLKFSFDDCARDLAQMQDAQVRRLFLLLSEPAAVQYIKDGSLLKR